MVMEVAGLTSFLLESVNSLPSRVLEGDLFAVTVLLIFTYVVVFLINKLTGLIIFLLKKLFLLTIVTLALFQFLLGLSSKVAAEGFTLMLALMGGIGLAAGLLAVVIALYSAFYSFKQIGSVFRIKGASAEAQPKVVEAASKPAESQGLPSFVPKGGDKSVGVILVYVVIAEFGVFSSYTTPPPVASVGLGFFVLFLAAALLFVRRSYKEYQKGLFHLFVALVFGGVLSVLLGHFWGNYSVEQLLSLGYFASNSLVALLTGLSLSIFMGSKG
ncbi:Uncharacterised protein [uncultured archaeon]|nr:Uncharacterised protein [uncultured archaeon]